MFLRFFLFLSYSQVKLNRDSDFVCGCS